MCPSVAVLAGGGDGGGGGGGSGGDGSGDNQAGAGSGGEGADGDGRNAGSVSGADGCGGGGASGCPGSHPSRRGGAARGDPVDVVTGRVFTVPVVDLALTGPMPLVIERSYSSAAQRRDIGLGYGWSHSLGFSLDVGRRSVALWTPSGVSITFALPDVGGVSRGVDGWQLRRESWGYVADAGEERWYVFFHEPGRRRLPLASIRDIEGNEVRLLYVGDTLAEVHDSVGRVVRVEPTSDGRIASFSILNAPSQGRLVTLASFLYDDRGDLVAATDAEGYTTRYTYHDDHLLTSHTSPTGLTFSFVYDDRGRCVETWGSYGDKPDPCLAAGAPKLLADDRTLARGSYHCRIDYHHDGYSEVTDSVKVQRFFGNRFGRLDKAVSSGAVFTRSYDEDGHVVALTDALGGTTAWTRDDRGRVTSITDALGRVTTMERDRLGRITRVIDPEGAITTVHRDRDVLTILDALGGVSSVRFDGRGLVVEEVGPNGGRTAYSYDAFGNRVETKDRSGAVHREEHDYWGRLTAVRDPLGNVSRFSYDNRGDVIAVTGPDGGVTRYAYDGSRNLTGVALPGGGALTLVYGGLNALASVRKPNGDTIHFRYDREGQLVEVHNERGEVHRYALNAAGRTIEEHTFDGRKIRYRYDIAGRLVSSDDGVSKVERVYDLVGQLIERRGSDGSAESFSYNGRGEIVGAASDDVQITLDRDALGQIVRETQIVGGSEHTIERVFAGTRWPVRRVTSLGHDVTMERDAMGRCLRAVLDGAEEVTSVSDALGREIARNLPGGGRIETGFDALSRIARRRVSTPLTGARVGPSEPDWVGASPPGVTIDMALRYTAEGDLAETWDMARGRARYEHDALGQLLARLPEGAPPELFRYDAGGSLFEHGEGAVKRAYGPGGRVLQRGDTDYRWDDAGRLIEARTARPGAAPEVTRYTWTASGRLSAVDRPDGSRLVFTYDPFSRRLGKHEYRGGELIASTRFVWDGAALVHEVRERAIASGDPVIEERTYLFDDRGLAPLADKIALRGAGATAWRHYVNDSIGSPDRLVGARGEVLGELRRTAWGAAEGAAPTPLRFAGQYQDDETGLSYNRFRYYDPSLGRYLSPDPIGLKGGYDLFGYAENQPTSVVDPEGLFPDAVVTHPRYPGETFTGSSGSGGVSIDPLVATAKPTGHCAEPVALTGLVNRMRGDGLTDTEIQGELGRAQMSVTGKDGRASYMRPCEFCAPMAERTGVTVHAGPIRKKGNTWSRGRHGVYGMGGQKQRNWEDDCP